MTSPNDLRTELLANADRLEAEDDTLIAYNIREAVAALDERDARIKTLEAGLDLACRILGDMEPPDSRAVSDEFVAMFSVLRGNENEDCLKIIQRAAAEHEVRNLLTNPTPKE